MMAMVKKITENHAWIWNYELQKTHKIDKDHPEFWFFKTSFEEAQKEDDVRIFEFDPKTNMLSPEDDLPKFKMEWFLDNESIPDEHWDTEEETKTN